MVEIKFETLITGRAEKTIIATFPVTVKSVISYLTPDGDVRDADPDRAKQMFEDAKREAAYILLERMTELVLPHLEKKSKGMMATPFVKKRLTIVPLEKKEVKEDITRPKGKNLASKVKVVE